MFYMCVQILFQHIVIIEFLKIFLKICVLKETLFFNIDETIHFKISHFLHSTTYVCYFHVL